MDQCMNLWIYKWLNICNLKATCGYIFITPANACMQRMFRQLQQKVKIIWAADEQIYGDALMLIEPSYS